MISFAMWLEGTSLSRFVIHYAWVWPTMETLHFIGLALLVGNIGVLDLRLLGMAKALPVAPFHRLVRYGVYGFIINMVTGILFFVGRPLQYVDNPAFGFKMLFVVAAGVNVALFKLTGVARTCDLLGPWEDAPGPAKVIAATSLLLWIGVMFWGRMLPYLGNSF